MIVFLYRFPQTWPYLICNCFSFLFIEFGLQLPVTNRSCLCYVILTRLTSSGNLKVARPSPLQILEGLLGSEERKAKVAILLLHVLYDLVSFSFSCSRNSSLQSFLSCFQVSGNGEVIRFCTGAQHIVKMERKMSNRVTYPFRRWLNEFK